MNDKVTRGRPTALLWRPVSCTSPLAIRSATISETAALLSPVVSTISWRDTLRRAMICSSTRRRLRSRVPSLLPNMAIFGAAPVFFCPSSPAGTGWGARWLLLSV